MHHDNASTRQATRSLSNVRLLLHAFLLRRVATRRVALIRSYMGSTDSFVEMIERLEVRVLVAHDIALEPPWKPSAKLVPHERA
jgi:hypothetical protein